MLLSVIIPIFNSEKWLRKCLDSVVGQQLEENSWEIILVDDGSQDGSSAIADEFAIKLPKLVKVLHKSNGGVSSARNAGLDIATGTYIHFMDSDDWIIPGAYKYLIDNFILADERTDLLGFWSVTLDNIMRQKWVETFNPKGYIVYEGTARDYYNSGHLLTFSCMGFYRRKFLEDNEIRFSTEHSVGEDTLFNLDFALHNPYLKLTSCVLYRYEVREGSATQKRDVIRMRQQVTGYEDILLCAARAAEADDTFAPGMRTVIESQIVPFASRLFSSDLTKKEFIEVKSRLSKEKVLPLHSKDKLHRIINTIFRFPIAYIPFSLLYKYLFIPIILPKLSRN